MGKVTKVEIVTVPSSAELSVRIKRKGKSKFEKPIILKGKGMKKNEHNNSKN
ncbi:unnamed protein product [marine sediment metagenome]|uniref:Uncharacterized protein n=1 Tax=marine sediment metagenome TaxID=412755 RepID=X1J2V5_9ZZZZ